MSMSANSQNDEPEKVMCEKQPMQDDGIVPPNTANKVTNIIEPVE